MAQRSQGADEEVYEHSVLAQASALNRRNIRAAAENKQAFELCPAGRRACAIKGPRGDYVETGFEVCHLCFLHDCGLDGAVQDTSA